MSVCTSPLPSSHVGPYILKHTLEFVLAGERFIANGSGKNSWRRCNLLITVVKLFKIDVPKFFMHFVLLGKLCHSFI